MIVEAIVNSVYEITGNKSILSEQNSKDRVGIERNYTNNLYAKNLYKIFPVLFEILSVNNSEESLNGIMLRIGRSSFDYLLNTTDVFADLTKLNFRLLARPKKILIGMKTIVQTISMYSDVVIILSQDKYKWTLSYEIPRQIENRFKISILNFWEGFFQAFMYWVSSGYSYNIYLQNGIDENLNEYNIYIDKVRIPT